MDTHIQTTHTSHTYTHSYKQRTVTLKKQAIKENPLFLEQNTLLYYKTDFFFLDNLASLCLLKMSPIYLRLQIRAVQMQSIEKNNKTLIPKEDYTNNIWFQDK